MSTELTFIVWLDPGATTGCAAIDLETMVFSSGQYDLDGLREHLYTLIPTVGRRMAIGWEMFIGTSGGAKTSTPGPSNEVIGMVRSLAQQCGIEILKSQPSSARSLGSPAFLRRMGWHKPGKGHANDASQHLLAHLLKMRPMPDAIRGKLFPGYTTVLPSAPE